MASLITAFTYKKKLKFDTDTIGVDTNQTNFPVCVHINTSSWATSSERDHFFGAWNIGGKRCQFFDADGTTNLDYEVDLYAPATPEAIYFIRAPQVDGNSSADYIWVAFGNDPNGTDQDNPTGVWNSNFKMVQHLGLAPTYDGANSLRARFPAMRYSGTYNRTYFTWLSAADSGSVIINYYDHTSLAYGSPVTIRTGVGINVHYSPVVFVIPSGTYAGYILVAFQAEDGVSKVYRSTAAETLTFGSAQSMGTFGAFPQLVQLGNGNIAFFGINIAHDSYTNIAYQTSTDGGASWSSATAVVHYDCWHYPVVIASGNTVHIAWHDNLGGGYNDVQYIYSPDNLATWRTQGSSTPLSLPIDKAAAEMVYDHSGTWVMDIQLDGSGSPVIVFVDHYDTTSCLARWAHYSSGWSVHSTGVYTIKYGTGDHYLIPYNSGIFIEPTDTTHVYIGVKVGSYSDIQEWHTTDGGTTWAKVTDITSGATCMCGEPRPVVNYTSTFKLFFNMITSWTDYDTYTSTVGKEYQIGSFLDSTSNNNDGTDVATADVAGKVGRGRVFNGSSSHVTLPYSASLNVMGADFSFSFWTYFSNSAASAWIFQFGEWAANKSYYQIRRNTDNKLRTIYSTSQEAKCDYYDTATTFASSSSLKHIVVTYTRSTRTFKVYVDSVEEGQATSHIGTVPDSTTEVGMDIGVTGSLYWLNGVLDELRIYGAIACTADWAKLEYYSMKKTNFNGDSWLSWDAAIHFVTGSASLSGVGSLTAAGKRIRKGTASASGIGALTVAGGTYTLGAASLSGVGTLTAIGEVIAGGEVIEGAASLSGASELAVSATTYTLAASSLSGVGTLTSIGKRIFSGLASLEGAGTLTVSVGTSTFAACSLSGIGTLTSSSVLFRPGAASLQGIGSLVIAGRLVRTGGSALSGAGTLSVTATTATYASSSLQGVGTLTASGIAGAEILGISALQGVGILSSIGELIRTASSGLEGIGTLAVSAHLIKSSASSLEGVGILTAEGQAGAEILAEATLESAGTLLIIGRCLFAGESSLDGAGTLNVNAKLIKRAFSSIEGVGLLTISGRVTKTGQAILEGTGSLTVSAEVSAGIYGAASIEGIGTLTSSGKRIFRGASSLSGVGTLSVSASIYTLGAASLSGIGTLTSIGGTYTLGTASLSGVGLLTTSASTYTLTACSLSGIGTLTASGLSLTLPVGITQTESNVEQTTARINGKISDDGGASCEARFRWRSTVGLTEEQTQVGYQDNMWSDYYTRLGQKLTISNRTITKLTFKLVKTGSPTGDVTFTIRKLNDDIIASKVWGDASALSGFLPTWYEKELDTPVLVNEEVRISAEFSGGNSTNFVSVTATSDCKANEVSQHYAVGLGWGDFDGEDRAYKYTYGDAWTTTDWQNTLVTDSLYHEDLTGLELGTEYEYQTQAKNSLGEGEWSSSETFTTQTIAYGATSLSGAGTLSTSGKLIRSGKGTLAGVGSLSITGKLILSGTSSITGVGSLTIMGATSTYASASLQGVGTLTAIGKAGTQVQGASVLEGVGTLSSLGRILFAGASSLSGVGTLTIISEVTRSATANLQGIGSLTISASLIKTSGSVLEGVGILVTEASVSTGLSGEASLQGVGTLSIMAKCIFAGASSLIGEGTLTIGGKLIKTASSSLEGVGSLSISSIVYKNAATVLTGVGTLETASRLILGGVSALQGIGTFTAEGQIIGWIEARASLEGVGTLSASAILSLVGASSLEGVGLVTADGTLLRASSQAQLSGAGSLSVIGSRVLSGASALTGIGEVTVSAGVIHYGASSLQGIGLLTAEIKEINFGSASLSGIGALLIVASLFKRGASDLNGVGLLVGQAIVLKSGRVILVGTGTLAIAATLLLTGQATMLGVGTLTAAWTEVITRHQDWIWKMPDRDLTMAMPVRNRTFKVRQHG